MFNIKLDKISWTQKCITRRLGIQDQTTFLVRLDGISSRENLWKNFVMKQGTFNRTGVAFCLFILEASIITVQIGVDT